MKLNLREFILKEFLMIFPLALYLSGIWSLEYFNVFLILPASFYVIKKSRFKILDINSFLILLFSILYYLLNINALPFERVGYVGLFQQNLLPFLFYVMGKYLNKFYDQHIQKSYVILIIAFIFSINPFISNIVSIIEIGFMSSRDVNLLVSGLVYRQLTATNMSSFFLMNMSFFPFLFISTMDENEKKVKYILIGLFLMGFTAVTNVSTRTGLLISAISWLTAILFNKSANAIKILGRTLLFLTILGLIIYIFGFNDIIFSSELFDRFTADGDNSLLNSRSNIWEEALRIIFPTSDNNINNQLSIAEYAHNLWLDVALKAGIYPLILLLIITINYLLELFRLLKQKLFTPFYRVLIVCITVAFYSTFMVEPIMDGYYTLFCLFCFFFGFITIDNKIINFE